MSVPYSHNMLPCLLWPKRDVWLSGLVLTCEVEISIICRVFSLLSPHTCDCTVAPHSTYFAHAASQRRKFRVTRAPLQYKCDPARIHTARHHATISQSGSKIRTVPMANTSLPFRRKARTGRKSSDTNVDSRALKGSRRFCSHHTIINRPPDEATQTCLKHN